MEESNTTTKNISGFAEFILLAAGLVLLFAVPVLYSLDPPSTNPISTSTGTQASLSLKKP